jgi:hypothetical protein
MRVGQEDQPTDGPRFDDVTFPVDVVYTWVDGDDPAWLRARDEVLGRTGVDGRPNDAVAPGRFRSHDELRYSLRSLAAFAHFVRRIFIVTAGQVPPWLNVDHPRVRVVDHREIFPPDGCLPTFNSHAIESRLHHIQGLAEHYLYMNDDFLFGRPVTVNRFFHGNGMTRFFLSHAVIGGDDPADQPRSVDVAAMNTVRIVGERFGRRVSQKLKHAPYPQRRSVLFEMEAALPEEFTRTAASRVRGPRDVAIPSSLFHYYSYLTGRAVPGRIRSRYVTLDEKRLAGRLRALKRKRNFDVVCINDSDETPGERRRQAVGRFMRAYWSTPSPYER